MAARSLVDAFIKALIRRFKLDKSVVARVLVESKYLI